MPATKTLVGVGVPPAQAARLGFPDAPPTLAGVGTAQVGGAAISQNMTVLSAIGGATAFVMPAAIPGSGPFVLYNASGTSALVYPGSGLTWNGGSADVALTLPTLRSLVIYKTSATNWIAAFNATS